MVGQLGAGGAAGAGTGAGPGQARPAPGGGAEDTVQGEEVLHERVPRARTLCLQRLRLPLQQHRDILPCSPH